VSALAYVNNLYLLCGIKSINDMAFIINLPTHLQGKFVLCHDANGTQELFNSEEEAYKVAANQSGAIGSDRANTMCGHTYDESRFTVYDLDYAAMMPESYLIESIESDGTITFQD
jgi:hypothetical protein